MPFVANNFHQQTLTPELYDAYASPVYGKILSIVNHDPIAEKILEEVFVSTYTKNNSVPKRSPLMSLIDLADKKSNKILHALKVFNACCSGTTVSINDKK